MEASQIDQNSRAKRPIPLSAILCTDVFPSCPPSWVSRSRQTSLDVTSREIEDNRKWLVAGRQGFDQGEGRWASKGAKVGSSEEGGGGVGGCL